MSLELLDKTRRLNNLLHKNDADVVDFREFCHTLSQILETNVLLISGKGKVLGLKTRKEIEPLTLFGDYDYGTYIDAKLGGRLMNILSTNEHVNLNMLGMDKTEANMYFMMVTPVDMAGKRLGSLIVYRKKDGFSIDDVILNEYAATIIGLAMQRSVSEERYEEHHKEEDVATALETLSKLEKKAILSVLDEMGNQKEKVIVTSKLADQVGITRSVLVNALKKCAGAGVLQTKSAGKKGTVVKITNEFFEYKFMTESQ